MTKNYLKHKDGTFLFFDDIPPALPDERSWAVWALPQQTGDWKVIGESHEDWLRRRGLQLLRKD